MVFHMFAPGSVSCVNNCEDLIYIYENDIVAHRYSFLAFLFWHYIIVVLGIYHANLSLCTDVEKS